MIKDCANKLIAITVLLLCFNNAISGQIQGKNDTILCPPRILIIEYPELSKVKTDNYEEGFFKTISCISDTAAIVIHCGSMVNLPFTNYTNKTITSEFLLDKDIRSVRGYYIQNGRKKYFREDNYKKYRINVLYDHVDYENLDYYERIFNNIKIQNDENYAK
ncbi:MAG: hypothetical protein ACRCSR_00685 [Bacteroidales bacterium]